VTQPHRLQRKYERTLRFQEYLETPPGGASIPTDEEARGAVPWGSPWPPPEYAPRGNAGADAVATGSSRDAHRGRSGRRSTRFREVRWSVDRPATDSPRVKPETRCISKFETV